MNITDTLNDIYSSFNNDSECKYFNSTDFNNSFPLNDEQNFSVIHCNIRSMKANGEDLTNYLETLYLKFDIICLSETWIKDIQYLNSFFPTYHGFHSTRPPAQRGGGVSIFIKRRFNAKLFDLQHYNLECFENIFIHFSVTDIKFHVACIYRPPSSDHEHFLRTFESITGNLRRLQGECILVGDFNYDMLKVGEDTRCSDFYDLFIFFYARNIKTNSPW